MIYYVGDSEPREIGEYLSISKVEQIVRPFRHWHEEVAILRAFDDSESVEVRVVWEKGLGGAFHYVISAWKDEKLIRLKTCAAPERAARFFEAFCIKRGIFGAGGR